MLIAPWSPIEAILPDVYKAARQVGRLLIWTIAAINGAPGEKSRLILARQKPGLRHLASIQSQLAQNIQANTPGDESRITVACRGWPAVIHHHQVLAFRAFQMPDKPAQFLPAIEV